MKRLFLFLALLAWATPSVAQSGYPTNRFAKSASAPTCNASRASYVYYNTTDNKHYKCNGTSWAEAGGVTIPGSNNQVLTSDGSNGITAESGLTYDGSTLSVSGTLTGPTNLVYTSFTSAPTMQPTADVSALNLQCFNGTNTASVFRVLDKTGAPLFDIDCNGNFTFGPSGSVYAVETTPGSPSAAAAGKVKLSASSGSTPANRWGQSYDGGSFTPFALSPTTHFISFEGACQNTTASFSLDTPTSNAPAATCVTGSNVVNRGTLNFDASTDETVYGSFFLPSDWTGAIDLAVEADAVEAGTNVARLSIATACVAAGETADPSFNTAQTFAWTNTGSGQRVTASQTSLTTTGCAASERLFFKFFRDADGTSGTDSLGVDLRVWALRFTYRRAQ